MSESAWKLLLLLLALGLLTAPLMAALPSPTERRRGRLRQRAMQLGLRVRLAQIPGTTASHVHGAAYSLERSRPTKKRASAALCWLRSGRHWQSRQGDAERRSDDERFERVLGTMPETVQAVECNSSSIVAYWNEVGGESDVDRITKALCAARDLELDS